MAGSSMSDGVLVLGRRSGNPWVSELICWFLVQVVLFAGKLNTVAGIVTIFFLLVYAAVNLACLALEWASAPNFSSIQAFASIAFLLLLWMLIHCLPGAHLQLGLHQSSSHLPSGSQVLVASGCAEGPCEVLEVLLMVANPHTCTSRMTFIKDLKKSGLYVLGHVKLGLLDGLPTDPLQSCYNSWLSLVDHLKIKVFVNLTLADSVRHGVQNLLFISGFGRTKSLYF
ncbi:solute carrier family 12 member 9-like [Xiphophorus couchianus]|uniref:solute carrier family 12 member 9-like n=1 Tax=Xiphophorus couchianus TaxID=32473 RepID=UPI0010167AA8|nr:solute carrier family 12 member 9-like [Xiphophorus couchianus]